MDRREALKLLGGSAVALAGARAADNVLLGYGVLVGTNLREQDFASLLARELDPSPFEVDLGGARVGFDGEALAVAASDRERILELASTTPERAAAVDDEFDLPDGPLEQLAADLPVALDGDISFEFAGYDAFFDRLEAVETRPFTVEALRDPRWTGVDPTVVETFTGVDPGDTWTVVEGLAEGFREHTHYDAARYVAGSIEDHVIFGAADLREYFESPTSFGALERGEDSGLFCWDFTHRSIEALQAVPAHRQTVPTFGLEIYDSRHGHVYTAIGSVHREGDGLTVPMTFVDYARSTRNEDLHARWLLGEGIDAYNRRHRATGVIRH